MIKKEYLKKLVVGLIEKNVDAIFISPSEVLRYLTDIDVLHCERVQGLFITSKGEMFYIVSVLNEAEIKQAVGDCIEIYSYEYDYLGAIKKAFEKYDMNEKIVAVNGTCRAVDLIDIVKTYKIDLYDGKQLLEEVTIIKTDEDLENLTIAAEATDKVYEMLLNYVKPGMLERNIKRKMRDYFEELGITESFGGMVASGPNTALPHYMGNSRTIQNKDIVMVDFGCKYNGKHSDMTRTFFIGDVTEKEEKIYKIVLEANLEAEEKFIVGMTGEELDLIARNVISKYGYGNLFFHGLGHGIGCCVHEAPWIRSGQHRKIENGMAFSIEPGIYFTNEFGVRIEDIVIIKDNKLIPINKATKELIVI